MTLQESIAYLKKAEETLATLVDKEQQTAIDPSSLYIFVYEQRFDDVDGWEPNYQMVYAQDIAAAFKGMGDVIKGYGLTLRQITYGKYKDMLPEIDRIHAFHKAQRERQKGQTLLQE